MTPERLIEMLSYERLCLIQRSTYQCNNDCPRCGLRQRNIDKLKMYDEVLDLIGLYGDFLVERRKNL